MNSNSLLSFHNICALGLIAFFFVPWFHYTELNDTGVGVTKTINGFQITLVEQVLVHMNQAKGYQPKDATGAFAEPEILPLIYIGAFSIPLLGLLLLTLGLSGKNFPIISYVGGFFPILFFVTLSLAFGKPFNKSLDVGVYLIIATAALILGSRHEIGRRLRHIERPVKIASGFIVVLLIAGSLYSTRFLSPIYLLQQLQVGTFLGIIACGMMVVILLGHIDLSIAWTLTAGAMMSTAVGGAMAIPVGICVGMVVGLINGLGVAYLRVPSMIFTLGMNAVIAGLMILHTGGFAPQTQSTELMTWLAVGKTVLGIPNALYVWIGVALVIAFILKQTPLGRYIYAIGNREAVAYLSGINTRMVIVICFMISGTCSALAGVLLAGYCAKAYQAMGDPYLLPSIAAVVLGGTHILGGRGNVVGTVVGVVLIVILQSLLSVMQMPEAGRQLIYGGMIIVMLLIYGRESKMETA